MSGNEPRKPFVVGFSGPACAGKSTLAKLLVEDLKDSSIDAVLVPEVARRVFKDFGTTPADMLAANDEAFFLSVQAAIFDHQTKAIDQAKDAEVVVCDRTHVDILTYQLIGLKLWDWDEELEEPFRDALKLYDLVFWCPRLPAWEDDGIRTKAYPFAMEETLMLGLLSKLNERTTISALKPSDPTKSKRQNIQERVNYTAWLTKALRDSHASR